MGYTLEKAHERITGKGRKGGSSGTGRKISPENVRMYSSTLEGCGYRCQRGGDQHLE